MSATTEQAQHTSSATYKLADNVLFQKVANETVILEPETGQYYTLDAVGTFMVERLLENNSQAQVVTAVIGHYQAQESDVANDLAELINELLSQGLLVAQ